MKLKTALILFVNIFVVSIDLFGSEMTAPLPPVFEPESGSQKKSDVNDAKFASDFLQQEITVKTGMISTKKMKIIENWKDDLLHVKYKDQEEKNTQNTKENARIWLDEAYEKTIKYLEKKQDAQEQFAKLYSDKPVNPKTAAWLDLIKEYKKFLKSQTLKDLLFKKGMHVLGYKTISFVPGNYPDDHKKAREVSKKTEKEQKQNEQVKKEIDGLEAEIIQQHKKIDAFDLEVETRGDRADVENQRHQELEQMMEQMQQEETRLKELKKLQKKPTMTDIDKVLNESDIAINFLPKFMAMEIDKEMNGEYEKKSVADQWKRVVKLNRMRFGFDRDSRNLEPLYNGFAYSISETEPNDKIFLALLQSSGINNTSVTLLEYLRFDVVKEAFMKLGEDTIAEFRNSPKNLIKPVSEVSTITVPTEIVDMTKKDAVETLLQSDLNPESEKAIAASAKTLNFEVGKQQLSKEIIEQAGEKVLDNLILEQSKDSITAAEEDKIVKAVHVAETVLEKKLEAESEPTTRVNVNFVTPEFRAEVAQKALEIAQALIEEGKGLQDFENEEIGSDMSPEQMAYFMGYVQFVMNSLKSSPLQNNAVQVLLKISEVLKVLNNQTRNG